MKTLILFLVFSLTCFAQQKLLKEYRDIKANQDVKHFFTQLSKEQPILANLNAGNLKQKPFSLTEKVKLMDFNFDKNQQPSKKFNVAKYGINATGSRKMAEEITSSFNKQKIIFPEETKKFSTAKKILDKEMIHALFEK